MDYVDGISDYGYYPEPNPVNRTWTYELVPENSIWNLITNSNSLI